MKPIIVEISGKQGSGKTSTALKLLDLAKKGGFPCFRLRFAGALYEIHDAVLPILKRYGLEKEDCTKAGGFMQVVGLEYGRKLKGETIWTQIVRDQVDMLAKSYPQPFITIEDCRFRNEFMAFPDALRVRLMCDRDVRKARTDGWRDTENHPSETDLDEWSGMGLFDLYEQTESYPESIAENIFLAATGFAYTGRKIDVVKALRILKGN